MKSSQFLTPPCIILIVAMALSLCSCKNEKPESPVAVARRPEVTPDYVGITIPPNMTPLNFIIREPGQTYLAKIHSLAGESIDVSSGNGEIIIPPTHWKALLEQNAGNELSIDISVKTENGDWNQYQTIVNTIAPDKIDAYLVYRYMMPSSYFPKQMQICQRNLENFSERILLDTQSFGNGCAHCHSFINNDPEKILIGIRSTSFPSATLYVHDDTVDKIDAKFGYTAWHPSGRIAAYSINDVKQFFHTAQKEIHDVVDLDSMIAVYDVDKQEIRKPPALSDTKRLETYPAWTPDGRYLYFCSAPLLWTDMETVPPKGYREVKYDLMRIRYDIETDTWGPLETVLRAAETGLSILLPRISPDGRFLLFCMAEYGCFPIYQPTSDLYLMDLETGTFAECPINSEHAEAWHSWSRNSRWIVFSSKRQGGLYTRPFISYVDKNGNAHKSFVLPQKDPSFYDSCYHVYSIPEFISEPVTVSSQALTDTIVNPTPNNVHSVTGATSKADSTDVYTGGRGTVQ